MISIITISNSKGGSTKEIRGNGIVTSKEENFSSFKNIQVDGAMDVYLSQGDFKPVKIEAEETILPYIEIIQEGDKIIVSTKSGYNLVYSEDIKIYITAPVYNKIDVSGAGSITSETKISGNENIDLLVSGSGDIKMDIEASQIKVDVSGSGSIDLKGTVKDANMKLSGTGDIYCYDLLAENAKVKVSGVGNAQVYASNKLEAKVSGVGNVRYKGNPASVIKKVSGLGKVKGS